MPSAIANGLTIEYETFGAPSDPAIVLVMGLATQMTGWRADFCEKLADRGFFVVRFDNRDVGLSTKLHALGVPSIPKTFARASLGIARPPYTLADMAADTLALLDALEIERAHFVGVSMGGMIAQQIAIEHSNRILSLTSIMSSPGGRGLPLSRLAALQFFLRPAARTRDQAIERAVELFRVIGSPAYYDAAQIARRAGEAYDRSPYRIGAARQLAAVLGSPSRRRALEAVRVPTTIVHGRIDPLLPIEHGLATARAIAGSSLRIIDDLAHDLPEPLDHVLIDAIEHSIARS